MLTHDTALRAYAAMINTLDPSKLEPLLADDLHYASQRVWSSLESKQAYMEYMTGKIAAIKSSGSTVWAEMGTLVVDWPGRLCVVLAQGEKDDLCGAGRSSRRFNRET